MEETKKLFTQKAIAIATYIGGPAAAGYLVKKNYESYNQDANGKKALIIGILSTLLIIAGIFAIPEHILDKIPGAVIPAIYTAIIYFVVQRIQGQRLADHKETGGKFYSGWKAMGIGAIFMVILLVIIAGTAFIAGDLSKPDFDATTYDSEMKKFIENEDRSLAVFLVIDSAEPQFLIEEFRKGTVLWKENKEIVYQLNSIENLPAELLDQNEILLRYCDLRIQHNEIIAKAISEETDRYVSEIDRIGMEINKLLEKLSQ